MVKSLPDLVRRLPVDPFILAILATVGLAALLPASGIGTAIASRATTVVIGLLFFLYGARLSTQAAWEGIKHWRLHAVVMASTFVLFPVLGLAARVLVPSVLTPQLYAGVLFLCVLPSTVQSSIAFTSIAGGNVAAAICSASLSNLAGVVISPLLVGTFLAASGGINASSIQDIALQLLAPFLLGQVARRWIADWVQRHHKVLSLVDRGSILLVVYTAFSAGVAAGIWHRLSGWQLFALLLVDVVLLAVVLTVTSLSARALKFSRPDQITIVFCGSKKSLATGLPMANILFAAHGVGLVVLPLMLFHQIQLMACAWLARRYAAKAGRPAGAASEPEVGTDADTYQRADRER
ncbi:bile acid:sodium symporter family protein [Fodinicola feengrottensis]|uniref:bile acid:sodium symporter family protein n=1 Tax=Fodinicola feengrottensis TaxID=435914 RepID=UPI0031DA5FC2